MSDNTEIKDLENTAEEPVSMEPHVNTKVMYYVVAIMVILAIISAILVVFGPDVEKKTDDMNAANGYAAVLNV